MALEIIPITKTNLNEALRLHIAPAQKGKVETVAECWAEAQKFSLWHPVILRMDQVDIGFAMYGLWKNEGFDGRVWLDRFFIDQRYQGRGYAKTHLTILLQHIRAFYGCKVIYLSVFRNNLPAISLYQKFGFSFTGELDLGGELVMIQESE
ncbi:MAG: GNAT family N-acetyltransferase [Oscillospiraceae bacterium]